MILEVSIAKSERWEEKRSNTTKFTYYFGFHSIAKNIEGRLKIWLYLGFHFAKKRDSKIKIPLQSDFGGFRCQKWEGRGKR